MLPLKTYIGNPMLLLSSVLINYGSWVPDKQYLEMMFFLKTGEKLDLKNPQTFGAKLQWLKLYNNRAEYTTIADKYAVKEYVSEIIGENHIIPTLGIWNKPEDIDFDSLPQQFVLKTTHGGGNCGVVICKDKRTLDKAAVINQLNASMKQNIYRTFRERQYKDIKPRIIAEQYLSNGGKELKDFKFYCFNGIPMYCQVMSGRSERMTVDFFDMNWRHMPFCGFGKDYPHAEKECPVPMNFIEMKRLSSLLSAGNPFMRVDLYECENKIYFGEMTLFPAGGMGTFLPCEWNQKMGDMIRLPQKNSENII